MNERALARVDLAAVERNCARLRRSLAGDAELCAVVKADGYGHGGVRCGGAALAGGATRLAVATAREAAELREAHADASLLTMGALTPEEVDVALAARSDVAVWRPESLALAADRARAGGRPARVHVKHDSGMGRLGNRDAAEVLALAAAAAEDPDLELAGVWTHFATADEPDSGFLATQLEAFAPVAAAVRERHPGVLLHAANSAATLAEPDSHYDMVRCGIAVYGLDPFGADAAAQDLESALSLHSYVADVKRFEPGDSAGYGRTWRASEPTWVGVLPIGYGDGVRRGLSNNADVLIGGRRRPLVGTVSMDNVTVDLGPETDVSPGDPAILIGTQGEDRITAEELASRLQTINYEVTCGISARVPREYG
jgi:alanine racemase